MTEKSKTCVVNVKKNILIKKGYKDFQDWNSKLNHVYIGRDTSFYVPGAKASKWANPFPVKKYGRDKCLELYRDYIATNKKLMTDLDELDGKELGCWCDPEPCHGHILVELIEEKKS